MSKARAVVVLQFDEANAHRFSIAVMDRDHQEAVEGMRMEPEEARAFARGLRQAADKCDEIRRDERLARARAGDNDEAAPRRGPCYCDQHASPHYHPVAEKGTSGT